MSVITLGTTFSIICDLDRSDARTIYYFKLTPEQMKTDLEVCTAVTNSTDSCIACHPQIMIRSESEYGAH